MTCENDWSLAIFDIKTREERRFWRGKWRTAEEIADIAVQTVLTSDNPETQRCIRRLKGEQE